MIGTIGLGKLQVKGFSRVPFPPAIINPLIIITPLCCFNNLEFKAYPTYFAMISKFYALETTKIPQTLSGGAFTYFIFYF